MTTPMLVRVWVRGIIQNQRSSPRTSIGTLKLYGATFDHVAAASRPIHGVVRDGKTNKPVPGVRVSAENTTFTSVQTALK